jgi:hypothetical protein
MYISCVLFLNIKYNFLFDEDVLTCHFNIYIFPLFLLLYETLQTANENMKPIIYFLVIFHVKMFMTIFNHLHIPRMFWTSIYILAILIWLYNVIEISHIKHNYFSIYGK